MLKNIKLAHRDQLADTVPLLQEFLSVNFFALYPVNGDVFPLDREQNLFSGAKHLPFHQLRFDGGQ